jgi:hypothetical protein
MEKASKESMTGLFEMVAFAIIGSSVISDSPVYQIKAVSGDGIC